MKKRKKKGKVSRVSLTIHLDDDIKTWLDQEVQRRRSSFSQVIRELILEKSSNAKT